jgi:hypothetical protein
MALAGPLAKSSETEKLPKNVFEIREDRRGEVRVPAPGGAHPSVPELIVGGALLRVREHAVSFGDFLEFLFCFLFFAVGVAVRMVCRASLR